MTLLIEKSGLTQRQVKDLLHYDPATGVFTWLRRKARPGHERGDNAFNTSRAGMTAGGLRAKGYIGIHIFDHSLPAHHLAWLYMTGSYPKGQIDHKDGNPANNAWSNLRLATASQNQANTKKKERKKGTASQYKGVERCTSTGKWVARICVNRKRRTVGRFYDEYEAHLAYQKAATEAFGDFARFS